MARIVLYAVIAATSLGGMHSTQGTPMDALIDGETKPSDPAEAQRLRAQLVNRLRDQGVVEDERVLRAIGRVPRHVFLPGRSLADAYADRALPIGYGQTISSPSMVARMSEALELGGHERVLEIGTGTGYHASVLSEIVSRVYTIEIIPDVGEAAAARIRDLEYDGRVTVRIADGNDGWPDEGPFDRILMTTAPAVVPDELFDELTEDGILVAPVGTYPGPQELMRYRKVKGEWQSEDLGPVFIEPMITILR